MLMVCVVFEVNIGCRRIFGRIIQIDFYWVDCGENCRSRFHVETHPRKICCFFLYCTLATRCRRKMLFLWRWYLPPIMYFLLILNHLWVVFHLGRRYQTRWLLATLLTIWVQKGVYQSLSFVNYLQLLFAKAALGIASRLLLIVSSEIWMRLWVLWVQSFGNFGLFVYKLRQFFIEFRIELTLLLFSCVGQRKSISLRQSLFVHFFYKYFFKWGIFQVFGSILTFFDLLYKVSIQF